MIRIYEFRGCVYKRIEITNKAGQTIVGTKKGKQRLVRVAEESLYDAEIHLRIYRPDFSPNRLLCLEHMQILGSAGVHAGYREGLPTRTGLGPTIKRLFRSE